MAGDGAKRTQFCARRSRKKQQGMARNERNPVIVPPLEAARSRVPA
jgi:hypothetical protein